MTGKKTDIKTLANLSSQAYFTSATVGYETNDSKYEYISHTTDIFRPGSLSATGFTAHSYYSSDDRSLVIAYAGSNPNSLTVDGVLDRLTDAQLAVTGQSVQDSHALAFASQQIAAAKEQYGNDISITFTGHSLGGFLAQFVIQELGEGSATVFNEPPLVCRRLITSCHATISNVFSFA